LGCRARNELNFRTRRSLDVERRIRIPKRA
jgi:hypothetical protein